MRNFCGISGSRRGYYKLRQHYNILYQTKYAESDNGVIEMLRSVVPHNLADGISAASMHCLEDLGYALSVGYDQGVIDAVAYLHHSHSPLVRLVEESDPAREFGRGDVDSLIDLLSVVGEDFELVNAMRRRRSSNASTPFSNSAGSASEAAGALSSSLNGGSVASTNGGGLMSVALSNASGLNGFSMSLNSTSTVSSSATSCGRKGGLRKPSTGVEGGMMALLQKRGDALVDYANRLRVRA